MRDARAILGPRDDYAHTAHTLTHIRRQYMLDEYLLLLFIIILFISEPRLHGPSFIPSCPCPMPVVDGKI